MSDLGQIYMDGAIRADLNGMEVEPTRSRAKHAGTTARERCTMTWTAEPTFVVLVGELRSPGNRAGARMRAVISQRNEAVFASTATRSLICRIEVH